jgi:hypothetical protein
MTGRLSPTDELRMADRLALREIVEAYASCADRRTFPSLAMLFTPDGVLAGYNGQPGEVDPAFVRTGRDQIERAMHGLLKYEITSHVLGQQSLAFDPQDRDAATGETYCLAHHLYTDGDLCHDGDDSPRLNRVMSIRYLDCYRRLDGAWLIAERRLAIDWVETRVVTQIPDTKP